MGKGWHRDEAPCGPSACTCTAQQIRRYLSRISGPLMDRVDVHIEMSAATPKLQSRRAGETSAQVRERVIATRTRQRARGKGLLNVALKGKGLRDLCQLDEDAQRILDVAVEQFSLTRSRVDSLLRVSRTLADLEGKECVGAEHIEEAINYRSFDRKIFA